MVARGFSRRASPQAVQRRLHLPRQLVESEVIFPNRLALPLPGLWQPVKTAVKGVLGRLGQKVARAIDA